MSDTAAQIQALADLKEDWDSYGAPPISAQSIERAKAILALILSGPPVVGPSPSGDVLLIWRGRDGFKFSLDINGDDANCSGFFWGRQRGAR